MGIEPNLSPTDHDWVICFFVTRPSLPVGTPSSRENNGTRERNRPLLFHPCFFDDGKSSATRSADSAVPQALRSCHRRSRGACRRNPVPGTWHSIRRAPHRHVSNHLACGKGCVQNGRSIWL